MSKTFGEKLHELRTLHGWTMDQLVKRINDETGEKISRGRLSMWEHDRNDPNFRAVQSIAKIFSVSVDYFDDEAGPLNMYRKDDEGAKALQNIYANSVPKRKRNILEFAKMQYDEQNK